MGLKDECKHLSSPCLDLDFKGLQGLSFKEAFFAGIDWKVVEGRLK